MSQHPIHDAIVLRDDDGSHMGVIPAGLLHCAECDLVTSFLCPWCCEPVCALCFDSSRHRLGACDDQEGT